jgi:hypothetical protein
MSHYTFKAAIENGNLETIERYLRGGGFYQAGKHSYDGPTFYLDEGLRTFSLSFDILYRRSVELEEEQRSEIVHILIPRLANFIKSYLYILYKEEKQGKKNVIFNVEPVPEQLNNNAKVRYIHNTLDELKDREIDLKAQFWYFLLVNKEEFLNIIRELKAFDVRISDSLRIREFITQAFASQYPRYYETKEEVKKALFEILKSIREVETPQAHLLRALERQDNLQNEYPLPGEGTGALAAAAAGAGGTSVGGLRRKYKKKTRKSSHSRKRRTRK